MTLSNDLRAAVQYIRDHGLRQDGDFGWPGTPCCTIGAVGVVMPDRTDNERDTAVQFIADTLGVQTWEAVADWNDRPETTDDDAIALLLRAADRAELQEAQ